MPLFRHLAPSDLDLLLARFQPVSAKPGEVVIREGDTGDRFYVIRSGQLRVVRAGRELARLGPGDAVGEMALLLDIPRTATVDAPAGAELLALDADDFHDLLTRYCHRETPLERLSHHRLVAHKRSNQEVSG
jgi:CRP-like cAMP-binding protein